MTVGERITAVDRVRLGRSTEPNLTPLESPVPSVALVRTSRPTIRG
jgi:hypothetical protein